MLELAILGLLKEHDMHGYELKKQLEALFGPVSKFSYGSLYPALGRLETAGAVESDAGPRVVTTTVPMTGSLAGELRAHRERRPTSLSGRSQRNRKEYRITPEGQRLFQELLAADVAAVSEDDRAFRLRVAFASYLPAEQRLTLFERRRRTLLERLAEAQAAAKASSDPYAAEVMLHTTEETERDLSWIDRLIKLNSKEA